MTRDELLEHLNVTINPDPKSTRVLGADAVVINFEQGRAGERLTNAGRAIVTAEMARVLVNGLLLVRERVDELAQKDQTYVPCVISVVGTHPLVQEFQRQAGGQGSEAN